MRSTIRRNRLHRYAKGVFCLCIFLQASLGGAGLAAQVRVTITSHSLSFVVPILAQQKGLYRDEGLEVELNVNYPAIGGLSTALWVAVEAGSAPEVSGGAGAEQLPGCQADA